MKRWRKGPFVADLDLSMVNRPHLSAGVAWAEDPNEIQVWCGIEWGNGNSDPVWRLEVVFKPPRWVARRLR